MFFEHPTWLNAVIIAQTKFLQQSKVLIDIISAIVNDVFSIGFRLNILRPFNLLLYFLKSSNLFSLLLMSLNVLTSDLKLLTWLLLLLLLHLHQLVFLFLELHRKQEILINDFLSSRSLIPILSLHLFRNFIVTQGLLLVHLLTSISSPSCK